MTDLRCEVRTETPKPKGRGSDASRRIS